MDQTKPTQKIGFVIGYGNQSSLDVTYNYDVVFFKFQYTREITKKNNWAFEVVAQPQLNLTSFDVFEFDDKNEHGIEVGMNAGFIVRKYNKADNLDIYFIISSGPLYVSDTPARQSDGLNFSSNLNLGVNIRLSEKVHFDFRPGVRHLSNARIEKPNRGINNVFVVTGLSIDL